MGTWGGGEMCQEELSTPKFVWHEAISQSLPIEKKLLSSACLDAYSENKQGKQWIQCLVCRNWVHEKCWVNRQSKICICINYGSDYKWVFEHIGCLSIYIIAFQCSVSSFCTIWNKKISAYSCWYCLPHR